MPPTLQPSFQSAQEVLAWLNAVDRWRNGQIRSALAHDGGLDSVTQNDMFALMNSVIIRARVDGRHARAAREILSNIGLKPSDAVNMLMAQIVARRGMPFAVQENGYTYAMSEYGATPEDVDAASKRMDRTIARERKAGTIKRIRTVEDLLDED